jgi:hypothetical protein
LAVEEPDRDVWRVVSRKGLQDVCDGLSDPGRRDDGEWLPMSVLCRP